MTSTLTGRHALPTPSALASARELLAQPTRDALNAELRDRAAYARLCVHQLRCGMTARCGQPPPPSVSDLDLIISKITQVYGEPKVGRHRKGRT